MKFGRFILWVFIGVLVAGSASGMALLSRNSDGEVNWKTYYETEPVSEAKTEVQTEMVQKPVEGKIPKPEIDEQLLTVNKWSRPGDKVKEVKYIVIHYLGNPKTTAQENRDYFESLKDLQNASMSANYIVGLDGEILQCVPDGEVAYASNSANKESISIENCNIDETGKFIKDTYISLVKLTAYLAQEYNLSRDQIIRHHDVTGKECPKYYVENEDAWEAFLDDVMLYMTLCKENSPKLELLENELKGLQYTYESKFDKDIIETEDKKKEKDEVGRPHDVESANETYEHEESHSDDSSASDNSSSSESSSSSDSSSSQDYYDDYSYDDNNYDYSYDDNNYYDGSYDSNNYDSSNNSTSGTDQGSADTSQPAETPSDSGEADMGLDNGSVEVGSDESAVEAAPIDVEPVTSTGEDFLYVDEDAG